MIDFGEAVMYPLRHSRPQVLRYTRLNVAPHPLQPLHQPIGGGGRCRLVGLVMQDQSEVQAVPWLHHSPPGARKVLLTPLLRFLGCVRW